jgi:hypothetical protein
MRNQLWDTCFSFPVYNTGHLWIWRLNGLLRFLISFLCFFLTQYYTSRTGVTYMMSTLCEWTSYMNEHPIWAPYMYEQPIWMSTLYVWAPYSLVWSAAIKILLAIFCLFVCITIVLSVLSSSLPLSFPLSRLPCQLLVLGLVKTTGQVKERLWWCALVIIAFVSSPDWALLCSSCIPLDHVLFAFGKWIPFWEWMPLDDHFMTRWLLIPRRSLSNFDEYPPHVYHYSSVDLSLYCARWSSGRVCTILWLGGIYGCPERCSIQ